MQVNNSSTIPDEHVYFYLQAKVGLTKHIGGVKATNELIDLCEIKQGNHVLDVGCGVGMTDIYLARDYGVRVTGIDINPGILSRADEYSEEDEVEADTGFLVADAVNLPFRDECFDSVICESVLVFVLDKRKTLSEFIRVSKHGGYVGFTESVWRGESEGEMEKFLKRTADPQAQMEKHETWMKLLESRGLVENVAHDYDVSMTEYIWKQIQRIGVWRLLEACGRTLRLILTSEKYRSFLVESSRLPRDLVKNIGYGVYTGKKP
jgi:ubiquinone/menaquinone biosynthesis C-methylase UbiE